MPILKLFILLLSISTFSINAEVKLPEIFSDNMVLQRNKEIPIWGTALPNEKVEVNFAGQDVVTTADEFGCWRIKLNAMKANSKEQV